MAFDTRLRDLRVNRMILFPNDEGKIKEIQLNGHTLDGRTAWILIHVDDPDVYVHGQRLGE